jgi:hypothetical protein
MNRKSLPLGLDPRDHAQKGLTIPTRGITLIIQQRMEVRWSFRAGGVASEPGRVFTACRIRNMQTAQFEIHRE